MFAHPLMLAWMAAAAVPLVLRLLGRAAERTVDFSAVLFLSGGAAAAVTGGRAWEWVLLAVRSAALGLLAVALARPLLPAAWSGVVPAAGLTAVGRATVAVVVDDAASTAYAHDGPSRFRAVTGVALGVLARLGRGDRACVVADPPPAGWVDAKPSADLSAAAAAVSGLSPQRRPADVADALTRAADRLADTDGPAEVVVVCDRSAAAWRNVTDAFGRAWHAGRPPRVAVVPVGGEQADNVSVESVSAVAPPLVAGVPGVVRVAVRNWGPDPVADVPVWAWARSATVGDATVSLAGRSSATVDLPARLGGDPGERVVSAAVRSAGLTLDDRRDGVVDVVAPARVLVVTDDEAAAFPLRAALAPNAAAGRRGADPAVVTVATGASWPTPDPSVYDVVILADVADVSGDRAADLRQFVDDGGGLLIAPGRHALPGGYDTALGGGDGVGLLPAVLAAPWAPRGGAALRLGDGPHPALAFAASGAVDRSAGGPVTRAFGLVGRPAGRVLATVDGQPAVVAVDGSGGGGRVVLSAVPLDATWSSLPASDLFVPLVQSAVRWLAGGDAPPHAVAAGRPIVVRVDGAVESASAQRLPDGRPELMRVLRQGPRTELRYERTATPGTYRVRYRAGGRDRLAFAVVDPPAGTSDLTPLSAKDWRAVARRVGFDRADPTPAAALAAVARNRGGPDGWAVGVGGVLLLLAGETLLGRRWSGAAERRLGGDPR